MHNVRGRELGLDFSGTPGIHNAITDVPGVSVGYTTLDDAAHGVHTGVTAILPRPREEELTSVMAGFSSLNGNGEMTGSHWVEDAGHFAGPICITNTHSVGIVHHAVTRWLIDNYTIFREQHMWAMPVVAETYDGILNDINAQYICEDHVFEALGSATGGDIAEGNVGGGTGMICYDFKGGTGTSSRRIKLGDREHTIGCLVQANHGVREWLSVLGVPVGRHLREGVLPKNVKDSDRGSIIVVLATDVPLLPNQLRRLAKRASLGLARTGTPGGNSSGDLFLAFSVANPVALEQPQKVKLTAEFLGDEWLDTVYLAAVEATEEAIINALLAARDMETFRPKGYVCEAIDPQSLIAIMRRYGRVTM